MNIHVRTTHDARRMRQAELAEAKQLAKQGQALAKRIVVVCGGAKGIGPDIASRLVREGAKVVVVDENAASAKGKVGWRGVGGHRRCPPVKSIYSKVLDPVPASSPCYILAGWECCTIIR